MTNADKKAVRLGLLAAEILQIVCDMPDQAYAHAITKKLNQQHGKDFTHGLEVGEALRLLSSEGVLDPQQPSRGPDSGHPRRLYKPTWKAGFYIGLLGEVAQRASAAA